MVISDMPERIQLSRQKGWRMPENTVKVDRTTRWGNPFVVSANCSAAEAVAMFSAQMKECPLKCEQATRELRGKNLACWCRNSAPCHADVLLKIANPEQPLSKA